jgi:hypothetical protein
MVRTFLTLAVLMMAGVAMTGCKAEVERTQTGVNLAR